MAKRNSVKSVKAPARKSARKSGSARAVSARKSSAVAAPARKHAPVAPARKRSIGAKAVKAVKAVGKAFSAR